MDNKERVFQIQKARELVSEAMHLVDTAIEGTSIESNYQAYGKYGFRQLLNYGNPYDDGLDEVEKHLERMTYDGWYNKQGKNQSS